MRRLPPFVRPLAAATGATAWLLAYRGAPTAFDEWLALPLALETARPGTYPTTDLLVQGSMQGPFHLYKLASVLWTLGLDVDVAWYVLLALSLVAFFVAVWRLGGALGLGEGERALLVMAIAVTPVYRGTLNWSAQPMLSFITASVAVPIGVLAIAWAIEGRIQAALILAALAFDVHPSIGLCAGIAVLALAPWPLPLRRLPSLLWLPAVAALPNLVYLLLHRPEAGAGAGDRFWEVFRLFGYHTFVRDHWRDGYPWFALALAVAIAAAAQLDSDRARRALRTLIVLTSLAVGWIVVMNVAPVRALMPLYLIRASLLAKPLLIGLALTVLTRRRYAGRYGFLVPWAGAIAVAHPDRLTAEAALAIVVGILMRPSSDRRLAALGAASWTCGLLSILVVVARDVPAIDGLLTLTTPLRWTMFLVGIVAASVLLVSRIAPTGTPRETRRGKRLAVAVALPVLAIAFARPLGKGWLPDSAEAISRQLHLTQPLPKESGAMEWARRKSPPGSLFAIPPVNQDWVRFRLAAERGVYASVHDINQLWYVRNDVFPAVARLTTLGVIAKGPHNFDARPYLHPSCARLRQLARDGVDFYVVPADGAAPNGSIISYRDVNYSIVDVKRTAPSCGV